MSSPAYERAGRPVGHPFALRMRVWVAGVLRAEDWVDDSNVDAAASRQALAARENDGADVLVELFDPDLSGPDAFLRFGTTTEGMRNPEPVGMGFDPQAQQAIEEEYIERLRAGRRYT